MAKGRRLILDRQHLIQMLSDPDFYRECPHFLWLRKTARKTYERFAESRRRSCCGGDFNIMRQVIDAFFVNLKELCSVEPEAPKAVCTYLERKKGYMISEVVIYYRATMKQRRPAKLTFTGGVRDDR